MARLMYSAADTLRSHAELSALPVPAAMGRFHRPVGFGDYISLVKHRLDRAGLQVTNEEFVTTRENQAFFGMMTINVDGFEREGVELTLGIRGSHDQTLPRGLCLGNRVIVCSNLCFSGDLANLVTRQTTHIMSRLPAMVDQAVSRIPQMAEREALRVDRYRQFEMRPRWGDAALVELFKRDALTASQLGKAVNEWAEPSHEEHAEDGFTAWRLLNAVTEAVKPAGDQVNMDLIRSRTVTASGFLDEVVGL